MTVIMISAASPASTDGPRTARFVPTAVIYVAYGAVAASLCALVLEAGVWRAVGLSLAVASTMVPTRVSAGWLLLVLGASQLLRMPSATDHRFYLLLAGLHLLHLLSGYLRLLPWRGHIEAAALTGVFRRYAVVQLFAQAGAAGALLLFAGKQGAVPGLSLMSAVLVVVLVGLFTGRRMNA